MPGWIPVGKRRHVFSENDNAEMAVANALIGFAVDMAHEVMDVYSSKPLSSPYNWTIEELEMSVRCYNICKRAGIDTIGQLMNRDPLFRRSDFGITERMAEKPFYPGDRVLVEIAEYRAEFLG